MAKKKSEKITNITYADKYGNIVNHKMTGDTGGYHAKDLNQEAPAMSVVGNNQIINNNQNYGNNSVRDVRTITLEDANKNLKDADNEFKVANDRYQNALSRELKKTGEDYRTKFDDTRNKQISYQTKDEDTLPTQPKVIPIQEANKNLQKELQERDKAYENWKIANYENNVAKVNNEKSTLFDKTVGTPIRAVKDLLSPLTVGEDEIIRDESGNKTFLPSYNELKQQKVRQDTGGLAGIAQDIGYNATKIFGATALDAISGGIGGKALYWTDMATDNFKNIKNQGYSNEQALANTILSTGSEFLTEKLLGGVTKELAGGKISQLDDALTNSVSKFISNPKVASVLGSMGSEGTEEFLQEWIGALNNKLTLGEDVDLDKTLQDSLYSALVGAGSGGVVRATSPNAPIIQRPTKTSQNQAQNVETVPTNTNIQTSQNTSQAVQNTPINEQIKTQVESSKLTTEEQTELNTLKNLPFELGKEEDTRLDKLLLKQNNNLENQMSPIRNLEDVRDYKGVGNKKVKAYQYENPEVKPYFQDVASSMLADLDIATKGERYMTPDGQWKGIKRNVADDIAELLDGVKGRKYTYKQIEDGLKAIIKDEGAENNAVSKRIEFYIDQRLRNGFTDSTGEKIRPNEKYIGTLREKNIESSDILDNQTPLQNENITERVNEPSITTSQNNNQQGKTKSTDLMNEIRQEVEEQTGKIMRKNIETTSKATGTVEDIRNMNYDDIVHDRQSHSQSKEQALRELSGNDIDTNINDVHAKFRGNERLTVVDSAKVTELIKQTKSLAEEAAKSGNDAEYNKRMEQLRELKVDSALISGEAGLMLEYAKVIKELDPESQIDVLNKFLEREQRKGNKKYENVKLNEKLVEEYKKAKTDEERDVIIEKIKDDASKQIKITFADKANEFRFLSMLGNLKTHGRNFLGNVGMYSLQSFKDGVAAIGEDIYNKTSKKGLDVRTKTLKPSTKEVSKFVNNKVDSFMKDLDNKYNESRGLKGDLEGRTDKFSNKNIIGKALNKFSKWNSKALDASDKFFSSKMTKQAMRGFLTANGIETDADIEAHPELVAQALDYALFKGKEATFHQDSTTAAAIRNFRDKLYTGSGFSKLGGLAVDTTLPFVSTPANIAKTALEYTPVIGFGDINKQFQNAPNNMKANVVIDSLSKQFSGAALMAVGAYLASQGLVKGSGDDDKEDKTEASLGNASYSIKIGNSTYDLSWLSPTAIPFFEGVEVFNAFKKANSKGGIKATDTADLIDTMFGTLNPMTDMSVLQSIERIITSIAYGGNAVKSATSTTFSSYLQQYIPTLLSQIAQVGDTKQRNTNTGGNVIEKTYDQIKYKIPGRRNTLPEKVDVWGDTNKTADNFGQRMFEAFLSPANRKDYKVDKTTKELERLARETDDTAMLPTIKNKSVRINKKDYDLKGKDYVNLQKTYGQTAKKDLDKLVKSDSYKKADDAEKKSMVSKLYDYASYKAKEKYAKNKGINFDSGNQTAFAMVDAFDIPYEKYVENKVSGNESASKMLDKLNEAGFSEAQKGAVMNYFNRSYYVDEDELYDTLENSNLSNKQKELIRAKYEKNITDKERERYKRATDIGIDYDLYTDFRSFVSTVRGESRSGGLTKKQKVINWIQDQQLTAKQKQNLYNDYINNQGIFSYYK